MNQIIVFIMENIFFFIIIIIFLLNSTIYFIWIFYIEKLQKFDPLII